MKLELLGELVEHRQYGTGTITACDETTVSVRFPESGEKRFLSPACFSGFLRLQEERIRLEVEEYLRQCRTRQRLEQLLQERAAARASEERQQAKKLVYHSGKQGK